MDPAQNSSPPAQSEASWSEFFRSKSKTWYFFVALDVFIFLNLLLLNVLVFTKSSTPKPQIPLLPQSQQQTALPVAQNTQSGCGEACREEINKATEAVKLQLQTSLLSQTPSLVSSTPTLTPSPTPQTVEAREYFVPLGSGYGSSTDWTTFKTIGATIDTGDYDTISNATFEAGVRIPTGNQTIYLRLLNGDNYQNVVGSDVSLSGGTPTLLISSPLTLSTGSNTYYVQLKTQLGYLTYIDFARIRIKTN